MIEALLVPIVKKAVDFLFDEGREIVRAHLRRTEQSPTLASSQEHSFSVPDLINALPVSIQSKDQALKARIDEKILEHHRKDLEHLLRLQEIQSRNYNLAKEQAAAWGKTLVPEIIINRIAAVEGELAETARRMTDVIRKIYGVAQTE